MFLKGLVEGKRNGGSRRVAMLLQRHDDLFGRHAELPGNTVENACVRLMWNEQVDVCCSIAAHHQRLFDHA